MSRCARCFSDFCAATGDRATKQHAKAHFCCSRTAKLNQTRGILYEVGSKKPERPKTALVHAWFSPARARNSPVMPNTATGGLTPSQRASLHAEKAASKAYRRAATPGPEARTTPQAWRRARARAEAKRPSSAFKSEHEAVVERRGADGRPGAVRPVHAREFAATSRASFGRSSKLGAGGFVAVARAMNQPVVDSPGPGSYNSRPIGGSARSTRPQPRAVVGVPLVVGAANEGAQPLHAVARRVRCAQGGGGAEQPGAVWVCAGRPFKHDKSTTHEEIGPGAYSTGTPSIQKDVAGGAQVQPRGRGLWHEAPRSTCSPFTPSGREVPGPGRTTPPAWRRSATSAPRGEAAIVGVQVEHEAARQRRGADWRPGGVRPVRARDRHDVEEVGVQLGAARAHSAPSARVARACRSRRSTTIRAPGRTTRRRAGSARRRRCRTRRSARHRRSA